MNDEFEPYTFASGNLLEKPNTYFYSIFKGPAFVNSFFDHRECIFKNLPPAMVAPPPQRRAEPLLNNSIETPLLLEYVLAKILEGEVNNDRCQFWLDRLVKKFEVTKRIHQRYKNNFRAVDPDQHKNYTLYIRLSEVFEAGYTTSEDIRLLNVLLKTIDTICSFSEHLLFQDRSRLAFLIFREKKHIENMIHKKGLKHVLD